MRNLFGRNFFNSEDPDDRNAMDEFYANLYANFDPNNHDEVPLNDPPPKEGFVIMIGTPLGMRYVHFTPEEWSIITDVVELTGTDLEDVVMEVIDDRVQEAYATHKFPPKGFLS